MSGRPGGPRAPARRSVGGRAQLAPSAPMAPSAPPPNAPAAPVAPAATAPQGRLLRKSEAAPPPAAPAARGSPARGGGRGRLRASSPAPEPAPAIGESQARREIDALIAKHNPDKLGDVDQLVSKYGEREFLSMVRKKYMTPPSAGAAPPPKSPTGPAVAGSRGRGRLRSPTASGSTLATPAPPSGTGRSLSRGRGRASSPAAAAAPPARDPAKGAREACEAGDWEELINIARARPELVTRHGLVDLARRHRAPAAVVEQLCEIAGLPLLAPQPPFAAQRLPPEAASAPGSAPGARSGDTFSRAATFSAAPRPPSAPAAAAVDEPPPPRGSEQASAAYFAAFAPAEIEAERPFDLSVRAFIAAMQAEVVREERAHHNELMGEMPESLSIRQGEQVRISLQLPACFSVGGGGGPVQDTAAELEAALSQTFLWGGQKEAALFEAVRCHDRSARLHWCCARIDVGGQARGNLQFLLNVVVVSADQAATAAGGGFVNSTAAVAPSALYTKRRVLVVSCPERGSSNHDDSVGPFDALVMDKVQELQQRSTDGSLKLAFDRKGSTTAVGCRTAALAFDCLFRPTQLFLQRRNQEKRISDCEH